MGRKGVGKLAPFGICGTSEVISAGGELVKGLDEHGNPTRGYKTSHFIMRRSQIMSDKEENYEPDIGALDETVRPCSGTKLIMTDFIRRQVPELNSFARQLAQRRSEEKTSELQSLMR